MQPTLTALMHMSLLLRLPREMHLRRSSSNVPRLPSFLEMRENPHVLLTFEKVPHPVRVQGEMASEPPKVARTCGVLYILTSKCASRHNGVHFFDIATSKSGPNLVCFVHFDFEMCFVPQRRALFRHRNFQKWSDTAVFCTFRLGNVLRATTACTFSTSQLPKVVRTWCALYILTSTCVSRHNRVHFFDISTSKSGPNLVCFVHFDLEMYFAPQRRAIFHLSSGQLAPRPPLSRAYFSTLRRHKPLEKHSVWRLSYLFAHLHLLSSDSFSSLIFSHLLLSTCLFSLTLPISAFHLSILSEV